MDCKDYEATIAFEKAANLDPEKVIYWLELGVAFNRISLFDEADITFDEALFLEPGNKQALFGQDIAKRGLTGQVKFKEWQKSLVQYSLFAFQFRRFYEIQFWMMD